jgi:hypothetical protein
MRHVLSPSLVKKSKKVCVWMSSSVRQQSDCKVPWRCFIWGLRAVYLVTTSTLTKKQSSGWRKCARNRQRPKLERSLTISDHWVYDDVDGEEYP